MTAYWIVTYDEISDQDKVTAYAQLAGPAIEGAGGRYLVRGLPELTFEAGSVTRTVVVEFPSLAAAVAAHDTPEYTAALAVLDGGAVRDLRIVPGVD